MNDSSKSNAQLLAELQATPRQESNPQKGAPDRVSDEFFRLTLAATQVGAWEWDIRNNHVRWSDEVAPLFGLAPGQFAGTYEAYLELIPAEERDEVMRTVERTLATGTPYHIEHSVRPARGGVRWVSARGSVLRNAEGKPERLVGVVANITDRKLAEQRLVESEERFRAYAEASHEGIAFVENGILLDVNPAAARLLGYESRDELIGRRVSDFVSPEDLELVRSHQQGGYGEPYEHRALRKDGSVIYVEASGRGVTHRGRPCRMVALRDVTARRQADLLLRQRDQTIRAIVETSQDWIWAIDLNGVHTFCNPAVTRILGYRPEELEGRSSFQFMHPDDQKIIQRKLPRWVEEKTGWQGLLLRWRHKDGGYRHLESSGVPILDESGKLTGFRGVDRDVTDREGMAEEKQQLLAQLRQSQKMEAVGQLAGGIAHDFNNILTVILGNAELVKEAVERQLPSDELVKAGIQEIESSSHRAATLTGQLLAFSRQQVSKPQVVDLNATLRELLAMLRRLITESIELNLVTAEHLKPVYVDPGQLQQVIMNLVVNARDAMPDGGVLTLQTTGRKLSAADAAGRFDVEQGTYSVLSVSDTGHGMDQETAQRIFEPFFTTKGIGKGTGLGLATAYGIIKQAGGYIGVYSEPGTGTTFTVHLPVTSQPVEAGTASVSISAPPTGTETVLVCEDESTVRKLTTHILAQAGYQVLEARSGNEAQELASALSGTIDLLVTDVIMPDMNGKMLAELLSTQSPALKTLFCSGYTSDVISHHGVLDPQVEFLEKPFTRRELLTRVRQILDG